MEILEPNNRINEQDWLYVTEMSVAHAWPVDLI